jgi:hypothetical protein
MQEATRNCRKTGDTHRARGSNYWWHLVRDRSVSCVGLSYPGAGKNHTSTFAIHLTWSVSTIAHHMLVHELYCPDCESNLIISCGLKPRRRDTLSVCEHLVLRPAAMTSKDFSQDKPLLEPSVSAGHLEAYDLLCRQ